MPYRLALLMVLGVGGLAGSATFLACSSDPAADGAECEDNGGCNSGVCIGGACAGRVCACTGVSCAKECDDGWVCSTRGATPGLSCARACSPATPCAGGSHCSDGICIAGPEITLAWVVKPGNAPCRLNSRCRYEVRANGEGSSEIATYRWTFGDAGVEGPDADIEYAYPFAGIYPVTVTPALKSGRSGPSLEATENVCVDDPEADCTPGGNDCCAGTCTVARHCR